MTAMEYLVSDSGATKIRALGAGVVTMRPNSALVSDACAAALRAFCSVAQRGRYAARNIIA